METSADPEPPENVPKYRKLNFIARWLGLGLVAGKVMPIMFSRDFMGDPVRAEERRHWQQKPTRNRHSIWSAVNGVIDRKGGHDDLPSTACTEVGMGGEKHTATATAK